MDACTVAGALDADTARIAGMAMGRGLATHCHTSNQIGTVSRERTMFFL